LYGEEGEMKYLAAFLACVVVFGSATPGFGHPPKELGAKFDVERHLLTIVVAHDVEDASKHYVNEIEVELNGKKMIEQKFKSQMDRRVQEVTYRIIGR
jgi:hypothetical protein